MPLEGNVAASKGLSDTKATSTKISLLMKRLRWDFEGFGERSTIDQRYKARLIVAKL